MKKKAENKNKSKKKKFIQTPHYPGGLEAYKKFIQDNLKYPQQALENHIEGFVHLKYVVDNTGSVIDVKLIKGLGHGCDEEAVRLISLLKYEKVKNRGLRVKTSMRTRIRFSLPKKTSIKYELGREEKEKTSKNDENKKDKGNTYSYTIKF